MNGQLLPNEFSKEMTGQHVAKYLHDEGQGWVNWFHHDSSQFVIARKMNLSRQQKKGKTGLSDTLRWQSGRSRKVFIRRKRFWMK